MADDDDLEYSETNVGSAQAQGVRKNISLKLKGKGRGRGRKSVRGRRASSAKKTVVGSGDDEDQAQAGEDVISEDTTSEKQASDTVSLDEVMSKLETPSFSPMERVFPEPLHQNKKLRWNHKVNLIGEKVVNPMIHCCEKCSLPILNYGRMIPCKHVFCYECAKRAEKVCPKCDDNIVRVEQTSLGSVFMCTFGGSRLGPVACGRTYLSQRDLQAHINHRHLKPPPASTTTAATTVQTATNHSTPSSTLPNNANLVPAHSTLGRDPRDPRGHVHELHPTQTGIVGHVQHAHSHTEHRDQGDHSRSPAIPPTAVPSSSPAGQSRQYPHSSASYPTPVPVSSARPNLITVPIQDDSSSSSSGQHTHQQAHSQQYTPAAGTPAHALPPLQQQQQQQHPPGSYPPPHAYQHPLPASTPTYSQAPPITTQHPPPPPVHHPPPPMHAATVPMYSTPPPPVHHPPPATYSTPPAAPQHTSHTLPPQRFQGGTGYDEPTYMQPWTSGAVPPPSRAPMPPPRPIAAPPAAGSHNLSHIPPRGPSDQGYRPPYYQ